MLSFILFFTYLLDIYASQLLKYNIVKTTTNLNNFAQRKKPISQAPTSVAWCQKLQKKLHVVFRLRHAATKKLAVNNKDNELLCLRPIKAESCVLKFYSLKAFVSRKIKYRGVFVMNDPEPSTLQGTSIYSRELQFNANTKAHVVAQFILFFLSDYLARILW